MTSWLCASTEISCWATDLVAFEQQVFERALQARHLLRQSLAAVLLLRAFGARHVIQEVDRGKRRRESQQDEGNRDFERSGNAPGHGGRLASGPGASTSSILTLDRSSFASSMSVMSRRPVTASSGCPAAQHPQVFLAHGNVQALLRLQELLAGGLLANAHAARGVLRVAARVVERAEPPCEKRLYRLGLPVDRARPHRDEVDDLARNLRAVEERAGAGAQELRAVRIEGDGAVHLPHLERGRLLVRLEVHDVDVAGLHAVERQRAAQHERAKRTAFHRHRLALEVAHRAHAVPAHDHVGAVRDVDHEDDPGLQPVGGEAEELVEADDHAVDGLVAIGAQHLARGGVLHELHDVRIEVAELAREIQRLAADPYVGADAQRRLRIAGAGPEQEAEATARARAMRDAAAVRRRLQDA